MMFIFFEATILKLAIIQYTAENKNIFTDIVLKRNKNTRMNKRYCRFLIICEEERDICDKIAKSTPRGFLKSCCNFLRVEKYERLR